jgi:hypothetical protein
MVNYIIKIECTHKNNLAFNDNIIKRTNSTSQNPPDITLGYISCIFPYIKNITIVYTKVKKFTKKYLEFICNNDRELSDGEFINFMDVLKNIGFSCCNQNTIITYSRINNDKNTDNYKIVDILKYNYKSLKKIEVDGKLKNYNSKYEKYLLNICKNIIV